MTTRHDPGSPWLLRRQDQAVVATLALVGLLGMAGYWLWSGGASGGLVDVDQQPRRPVTLLVDLNTADWPELSQLPGIGETLARRIVASREQDGPFPDHSSLLRVNGIGPKKLARVEPYLRPIATSK
jgi:competence protein ComEA